MIKVMKWLQKKLAELKKIARSEKPTNDKLIASHRRRVSNAVNYIDELNEVIDIISLVGKFKAFSLNESNNKIAKTGFYAEEFSGKFVKIVSIFDSVSNKPLWIIWTMPVAQL